MAKVVRCDCGVLVRAEIDDESVVAALDPAKTCTTLR